MATFPKNKDYFINKSQQRTWKVLEAFIYMFYSAFSPL